MKISEMITDRYKLRISPTVYYDLLADVQELEYEQEPRWIPLTKRLMTDEEQEYYKEWSDVEGAMIFDCPLPQDGQEVFVSYGGYVCVDTFCNDDGCYFEGVDIDDVQAWMPLPQTYKGVEDENNTTNTENN